MPPDVRLVQDRRWCQELAFKRTLYLRRYATIGTSMQPVFGASTTRELMVRIWDERSPCGSVVLRGQFRALGRKLDVNCCIVFEVKDGRIVDGREQFFDLHAWVEFW